MDQFDFALPLSSVHLAPLRRLIVGLCFLGFALDRMAGAAIAAGPPIDKSPNRASTPLNPEFKQIGTIRPRSRE